MNTIQEIQQLIQESKLGLCLKSSLKEIKKDKSLKLYQGPPGYKWDTSHFWVVDSNNKVIDPSKKINPNIIPKNYPYKGRQVNPESVLKELGITWDDI
jgi:hypothetical protein